MTKTIATILVATAAILAPQAAFALTSEMHVTKNGDASMSQAKVMQIAGGTLFARLYWGDAFIRFTIKTNSSTKFYRATGEATTIAEIKEGDILDTVGTLETGSNTINLIATSIKNSSVQKEQAVLAGTVSSVDLSARQFTMTSKDRGEVTVKVGAATPFTKGNRTVDIGNLRKGDYISKTSGDYDYATRTLVADKVIIYVDLGLFKAQNFAGKLVEAPTVSTDGTATLKILVGSTTYSVHLQKGAAVMRADRSVTTLQRFVAGDSIRFYGIRREIDDPIIDAEVLRNLNL
ncbi:MAG: hypothetical protein M0P64_01645 [Candidatus Pacebacteria bacterium]|jgi:hypothetical protein|nr:hypothetical protein [Candidatus Paceibacterota bacterium]